MTELDISPYVVDGNAQELHISRIRGRGDQFGRVANEVLGPESWSFAWRSGDRLVNYLGACQLYQASYERYFDNHPADLTGVVKYGEVYDLRPSEIAAGCNFLQVGKYVHIQDIAIRSIVQKRGLRFAEGAPLLQVRSTSKVELGARLSPFNVPFVAPDAITDNPLIPESVKWARGSVEDFYQRNRRLIVANLGLSEVLRERLYTEFGDSLTVAPIPE